MPVKKSKDMTTTPPGCGSGIPTPPLKAKNKVEKDEKVVNKECPPGKVLNPATNRCVNDKKEKLCPEGKVRNPVTKRCVKAVSQK